MSTIPKQNDTLDSVYSDPLIDGYIPNEETAIKVAEAIWFPIYGREIYKYLPFKAILNDKVWVVTGTLHADVGGTPIAIIQKRDSKIINVTHEE